MYECTSIPQKIVYHPFDNHKILNPYSLHNNRGKKMFTNFNALPNLIIWGALVFFVVFVTLISSSLCPNKLKRIVNIHSCQYILNI